MQPEDSLREVTTRARALWDELGEVYDAVERCLATPGLGALGAQVARMHALQGRLAPLTAIIATARAAGDGDAAIGAAWTAIDRRVETLLARCGALTGRAIAARDAVARDLQTVQLGRLGVTQYRGPEAPVAYFTSHRI